MSVYQLWGFFPTPPHLVKELLSLVEIYPGDDVLEPSAGKGNIALAIRKRYPECNIRVIEKYPELCAILKRHGFHGWQGDFLKHRQTYDVIIANPPFGNQFQDIDHFLHAWKLLRPGGRIAFILHEYSAFPKKNWGKPVEFVQFLKKNGLHRKLNPPGSFSSAERPTDTGTCMVWGYKPVALPRHLLWKGGDYVPERQRYGGMGGRV